jgi:hypothetical protein
MISISKNARNILKAMFLAITAICVFRICGIKIDLFPEAHAPEEYALLEDYLPNGLEPFYMGMPYEDFLTVVGKEPRPNTDSSFRIEVTYRVQNQPFETIIFYFDLDGEMPLYEFILEFPGAFDIHRYAIERYGNPNFKDEWRFDTGKGYFVRIWTLRFLFKQRLVIAGTIPGTEQEDHLRTTAN